MHNLCHLFLIASLLIVKCADRPAEQTAQNEPAPKQSATNRSSEKATAKGGAVRWQYRVNGRLDNQRLRCTGAATVIQTSRPGEPRCLDWRLVSPQCTGDRAADWVHRNKDEGQVCETQAGWELKTSLPGRAFCNTKVKVRDGAPQSILLECNWQCRGGADACAGEATYQFSALKK